MSTHDEFFIQKEGLAMGSTPAPHISNAWLSKYDDTIQDNAIIYFRYTDDIIRNINKQKSVRKITGNQQPTQKPNLHFRNRKGKFIMFS